MHEIARNMHFSILREIHDYFYAIIKKANRSVPLWEKSMPKQKEKIEFRYYNIPAGTYVLPKIGPGWEQEYGLGMNEMLHFHNYLEIGYCYHGSGRLIIEDREYRYSDNMYTFIPKNVPHTTISDPGNICSWEFLFIDLEGFIRDEFRSEYLSGEDTLRITSKRGTLKSMKNHPVMGNLIKNILRECHEPDVYSQESIKGYLYSLIIEVLRLDEERESAKRTNRINRYIKDAVDYISQHYKEDIKIRQLAESCGLSESHFRRIFIESVGMKPVEYLNLVRIERACALIRKGEHSMEEICYEVGYQTPSTFNRNFKIVTGISPSGFKSMKGTATPLSKFRISAKEGWEGVHFLPHE